MYDVFMHEPMAQPGRDERVAGLSLGHVQLGADAAVLGLIHVPEVNLTVWQRRVAAQVACEAVKLVVAATGEVRLSCRAEAVADALAAAMAVQGWSDAPCLRADVAGLGARFAAVMDSPVLALRLEVVTGDACRRFHADYVTARLICSYTGPGSEWVDNDAAQTLAAGGTVEAVQIRQLAAGDVALFKGRQWSETPIIHRSPPILGTGQRRLVLVINPAGAQD